MQWWMTYTFYREKVEIRTDRWKLNTPSGCHFGIYISFWKNATSSLFIYLFWAIVSKQETSSKREQSSTIMQKTSKTIPKAFRFFRDTGLSPTTCRQQIASCSMHCLIFTNCWIIQPNKNRSFFQIRPTKPWFSLLFSRTVIIYDIEK